MYIIINQNNDIICTSNFLVDPNDCASRGESIFELTNEQQILISTTPISMLMFDPQTLILSVKNIPINLDKYKENAKNILDDFAYTIRKKYITPNMDDIYREKSEQAIEYAAANYPIDTSSYPFIQAEANAANISPQEAADNIISARQSWMGKMADIEEERRRGKINIDSVDVISEIDNVCSISLTALNDL